MQNPKSEPAHVIMARNLTDARAGTAPREQILEKIAPDEGFRNWEEFLGSGTPGIVLKTVLGREARIPSGLIRIDPGAPQATRTLIEALRDRGMWGEAVGPVFICATGDPEEVILTVAEYSSVIGLVCDGTCGPGKAVQADPESVLDLLSCLSPEYPGLIHLTLAPGPYARRLARKILQGWPRATLAIVHRAFDLVMETRCSILTGKANLSLLRSEPFPSLVQICRSPDAGADMWKYRTAVLLRALRENGIPIGPMTVTFSIEDVRKLEETPGVKVLRDSIPGYTQEGDIRPIAAEMLGFATMGMSFRPERRLCAHE